MIDKDKLLTLALQELELEEAQTNYPSKRLTKGIGLIKEVLNNKEEPWSHISIGGDITTDGVHIAGLYVLSDDSSVLFYSKFFPYLKREWQGLTTQEIDDIIEDAVDKVDALIQTTDKLKEKNTL